MICIFAYGPVDATATHHCFFKTQTGLIFLVPAYPGCPGKEAINGCLSDYSVLQVVSGPSEDDWSRLLTDLTPLYVCILRVRVQPTLDPYAEAFL